MKNGRISNVQRQVSLDRAIWPTVMHHSSTSTYIPNFTGIGVTFCGRHVHTYVRTDGRTDMRPALLGPETT